MNKARFATLVFIGGSFLALSVAPLVNALSPSIAQAVQTTTEDASDRAKGIREEVAEKQSQMEQKIAEKKAAVQEKLQGTRAQTCQRHETRINEILMSRVDTAQQHFDTLKSIQERLEAFVANKQVDVTNASALETIMDDRQTSALASIEATRAARFSCADTDANAPGKIVMGQVAAEKQALKEYRTALTDYITAIKEGLQTTDSRGENQ
jgi:hypothetical protein